MTARVACFDINPGWGSHTTILAAELASLPPGALVIEHGAGVFSTPLIAQHDVRPWCIEDLIGWRGWARWVYASHGRDLRVEERAKPCVSSLPDASLVFIDGIIQERGDLLRWALEAGVPTIIAHDTEDDYRKMYGYSERYFRFPGYTVTSDGSRPQTTVWRKCA